MAYTSSISMSVVRSYNSQPIETISGSGKIQTGSIYFNRESGSIYVYTGTSFVAVGAGSSTSGTSGNTGTSGTSGINGTSGTSGTNGTSGSSGSSGTAGSAGSSGETISGTAGSSGTSGVKGDSGTSGTAGSSGTSGEGLPGTSGTSGSSGTGGSSGTAGSAGTSGETGDRYSTTSNSVVYIGTGAKSFTLVDTFLAYIPGQPVLVSFDSSNYMTGTVTSYNTGTNVLVINADMAVGSGTYFTWTVSLNGAPGASGTSGTSGIGGTSGTSGGGTAGTSGTSGDGTAGSSGSSGTAGQNGTSGTSGENGTSGTSGQNGTSGSAGTSGTSGNGTSGTSGTSGDGTAGTSGSSGTSAGGSTTHRLIGNGRLVAVDLNVANNTSGAFVTSASFDNINAGDWLEFNVVGGLLNNSGGTRTYTYVLKVEHNNGNTAFVRVLDGTTHVANATKQASHEMTWYLSFDDTTTGFTGISRRASPVALGAAVSIATPSYRHTYSSSNNPYTGSLTASVFISSSATGATQIFNRRIFKAIMYTASSAA